MKTKEFPLYQKVQAKHKDSWNRDYACIRDVWIPWDATVKKGAQVSIENDPRVFKVHQLLGIASEKDPSTITVKAWISGNPPVLSDFRNYVPPGA